MNSYRQTLLGTLFPVVLTLALAIHSFDNDKLAVPLYFLSLGLFLFWLQPFVSSETDSQTIPPLVIRPVSHDVGIHFGEGELLAKEENNLYLFRALNKGPSNLTNIRLQFELVDVDVRRLLEQSDVFEGLKINKYNEARLTTKIRNDGQASRSISIYLSNTGERKVDVIPSQNLNGVEFELPNYIKSALSILMLTRAEKLRETDPRHDATTQWALNGGDLNQLQEIQDDHRFDYFVKMPDLRIHATYDTDEKKNVSQTIVIESIYYAPARPMWWPDTNSGGEARFFLGGFGILSYENLNQPDQGHFNGWKKRQKEMKKEKSHQSPSS
ncbi:hypothetical protein [Nitrospina gracilis]|uniref:hypothetical protein n=1 Tax=Nitrospina gracilis TaxID=35801 RepID=UPI001F3CC5CD|nr:hypothetical protein [Nitrospina gracilis]MCF8719274.1 hypothetical protein [Nitrospina gracilis Nb-211]